MNRRLLESDPRRVRRAMRSPLLRRPLGLGAWLVLAPAALLAADAVANRAVVPYNLDTMQRYGKCVVELENAPIQFFHESFDGSHASGFAVSADAPAAINVRLTDPLEIAGVRVSFFGVNDLGAVDWTVASLARPGDDSRIVLSHRTSIVGQPDEVVLDRTVRLREFSIRFAKLLPDLTPAPAGRMAFRIGELELLVPPGDVMYVATPCEKWLFEPGFYPFETRAGRVMPWTGWRIAADGRRVQTVDDVEFTSSDPAVARMDGAVMTATGPGRAAIRAMTPEGFTHEVPIVVHPPGHAGHDLDVIRVKRLVQNDRGDWEVLSRRGPKFAPEPGDRIRYRATVVNLGIDDAVDLTATWYVDGARAAEQTLDRLPAAGPLVGSGEFLTPDQIDEILRHEHEATFDLDIVWQDSRQRIRIEIRADAGGGKGDVNPDNNAMDVASDALCFAYYTTELGYHRFTNAQQEGLKAGGIPPERRERAAREWGVESRFWREEPARLSSSIYDYIHRTCRAWDDQCTISRYPLTPDGVTESFRSKVVIIRDPASDRDAWGPGGGRAVWHDTETDVAWGWLAHRDFPWDECMKAAFARENILGCGFLFMDAPMIHESSHAHGLVDLYVCPMKNDEVMWRDGAGNRLWPDDRHGVCDMTLRWTRVGHLAGRPSMMVGDYVNGYAEHSAYAMQRMAGRRGRFYPVNNCAGNVTFGEFFNDIAEYNILELWTTSGAPVAGALVEISKREDRSGICDDLPEITGTTDARGAFDMGGNPVDWPENTAPVPEDPELAAAYRALHPLGCTGSDHAALRITTNDGKRFYKFLNAFDLNLAYWYAYGLEPNGWPIPKRRPDSRVVVAFTIDSAWDEAEAVRHADEVPTFGIEPPFDGKQRSEYERTRTWRRLRDGTGG